MNKQLSKHQNPWIWVVGLGVGVVMIAIALWARSYYQHKSEMMEALLVKVEKRAFERAFRRNAVLEPVSKTKIRSEVYGYVVEAVEDGSRIQAGDVIFKIDARPHKELYDRQLDAIKKQKADRETDRQATAKDIYKAKADAESRRLRLDVEKSVLKEVMEGPTKTDELNAVTALKNANTLLQAKKEEVEILEPLAAEGFVSQAEFRQKKLELATQEQAQVQAEIALRKLRLPPTVAQAEQELKVHIEEKNLASALEKAQLLENNDQRAEQTFLLKLKREETRLEELKDNLDRTIVKSPSPGVVTLRRMWGRTVGPGFELDKNFEVMTVADLRHMKAVLGIDEGRVGQLRIGMKGEVRVGLSGTDNERRYSAVITRISEKGRDEFEGYSNETRDRTGKANRQVFDVDLEIQGEVQDLRPGMRAEVAIFLDTLNDVIVTPESAIMKENGQAYVWLHQSGNPVRRNVNVLAEDGMFCSVDGLNAGDRVYLVAP